MDSLESSMADVAGSAEGVILTVSVASAIVFWLNIRRPPSLFRTTTKTASTALLALVSQRRSSTLLLPLALGLGSLGDAFLASSEGDAAFLGGLASFLAAHVAYAKLFVETGGGTTLLLSKTWRVALAAGMLLVAAPGSNAMLLPRVGGTLRGPVLAYSIAISAMFVASLTVDDNQVVGGALLFTISDMVLATDKFIVLADSVHRPWMQHAVWLLYYSGQLLIALGSMN